MIQFPCLQRDAIYRGPNATARSLTHQEDEDVGQVARDLARTTTYGFAKKLRKKVEILYEPIKHILGLSGLRLRGPCGAKNEFLLAAIAQYLRKLTASPRVRAGIARSYQKNNLFEDLTMRENLMLSAFKDNFKNKDVRAVAENVAEQIMLADMLDIDVRNASYGNRRQLGVALRLPPRPNFC